MMAGNGVSPNAARKARRRARRESRRLASIAATEAALSVNCPRSDCRAVAGVWCGPVLERAVFHPVMPWMHEARYQIASPATTAGGDDA